MEVLGTERDEDATEGIVNLGNDARDAGGNDDGPAWATGGGTGGISRGTDAGFKSGSIMSRRPPGRNIRATSRRKRG